MNSAEIKVRDQEDSATNQAFENSHAFAKALDAADPLKEFRHKFFVPQHNNKDAVYFTGNSLGLQPKNVIDYISSELEDWAALGVIGHHLFV